MTNQSSVLKLARFGAVAIASLALAGTIACTPKPATNTTNTTTTTTTNTAMAVTPGTPAGGLAPGGLAPGGAGGLAPGGAGAGGDNGGAMGGGNGGAMGGNGGGMGGNGGGNGGGMAENGGGGGGGGDAAGNQQWDRATYSSCVPSAMQQGASPGGASRYCACVVAQLDNLSLSQKEMLSPQSPELGSAVQACRPQAQGN